jgi:hypothetical protein
MLAIPFAINPAPHRAGLILSCHPFFIAPFYKEAFFTEAQHPQTPKP